VGDTHHTANGGNIYYVPTASRPHLGQHCQRGIERTPEHYIQGVRKILHGCRGHGAHLDNASIVDHNINASKALRGLIHYRGNLLLVGHITENSQDLGAALRQILPSPRQFLRITGGEDQPTSHACKLACQRQT